MSRLLTRRAPLIKTRPQPTLLTSHASRQRAVMSAGGPFFSQAYWNGATGTSILRRAYHPDSAGASAAYGSYLSGKRMIWTLIGLNTVVFGAWQIAAATNNHELTRKLHQHATLSEDNLVAGRYHTLVTSAFSHKDLGHFALNMVREQISPEVRWETKHLAIVRPQCFWQHRFLVSHWRYDLASFYFAIPLTIVVGTRVLILAIGSALASSLALHWQRTPTNNFKKTSASPNIWRRFGSNDVRQIWHGLGASGVVQGMGAAATLLFPLGTIGIFPFPFPVPLVLVTAGFCAYDIYNLDSKTSRTGHAAHLGGLAFGVVYYVLSLRRYGGVWHMLMRAVRK